MRRLLTATTLTALNGATGCVGMKSYLDQRFTPPGADPQVIARRAAAEPKSARDEVVPAGGVTQPAPLPPPVQLPPAPANPVAVDDFVRLAVQRNPRIARATIAIDAAQGHYIQAGLYPNPELAVNWDEIGDRTAFNGLGIITAPRITQPIVTGRKLSLSQAVAAKEIDQATLRLLSERYAVVGSVRGGFYEALAIQQRAEILGELAKLAEQAVANGRTLLENKRIARLDLVQLEVEQRRFAAEARAAAAELPGAYKRLAAAAGDSGLPVPSVAGTLEGLPDYDLEQTRAAVLATHPDVRTAKVGVERAQAALRRAQAEPIPNLNVYGAFIRQYENRSYDGAFGVGLPIPIWNRNQGNIRAAQAEVAMAAQQVAQVENELAARVAAAFQLYAAARERVALYRDEVIPRAQETYRLSLEAFKGGQFEYLRVIQAQRAIAEARLELNRSLSEAWRAAAELSGLLLEEAWPPPQAAPPPPMPKEVPKEAP
jgi:cobalt-zinc-cadmium efflux system outer membrane protein